jgi:prepilin-type N-terminal cleavage/methylation domain-containing protein
MNKFKSGFTLLEMLVVVGIISIILGATLVSYSTSQKKARDTKRKTDLRYISEALEQYYSICSYTYPPIAMVVKDASITCASNIPPITTLSKIPGDPLSGSNYRYTQPNGTSSYQICAPNTPPLESETTATYCIVNQQ